MNNQLARDANLWGDPPVMRDRLIKKLRDGARRPLAMLDAVFNRLYTWRANPLYHTGTLAIVACIVMLVTGIYLLLFYRIGSPYESVVRIQEQAVAGQWIRALHRYAADLSIVAAVVHAVRMFVQGRTWGPRALAWVSGLALFFLLFVCGWTGYVMVWDDHGQLLAREGARLMDALPIFSEPISRSFVGERPLPSAFFFLNLFAHIALPIGLALVLWIHVSRVARPVLLPPRPLLWGCVVVLTVISVLAPAPIGPRADPFALVGEVDLDVFYGFWLPVTRKFAPGTVWLAFVAVSAVLCLVPIWSRPSAKRRRAPSRSNEDLCTGCLQCSLDCPYEAISMVRLEADRDVARVDPTLCVSCGICAASCAPMVVGPVGASGRDTLAEARAFVSDRGFQPGEVVVVACANGAGRMASAGDVDGATIHPVACVGHLHTSVIELFLRSGAGGVLVASCPPRDCWNREGPKWLEERLHHGREAELRESLDRRRIDVVHAGEAEGRIVRDALARLRSEVADLDRAQVETEVEIDTECEPAQGETS
jgi:coenzyme F420-reducing hydrogenase delta subunit/Pyruvate/2-oxoacid:ferredoxin oxidoreductase delta subunit